MRRSMRRWVAKPPLGRALPIKSSGLAVAVVYVAGRGKSEAARRKTPRSCGDRFSGNAIPRVDFCGPKGVHHEVLACPNDLACSRDERMGF